MKNPKQTSKKSFFAFPDRINLLTYFLLIVFYAFILGVILIYAIPKTDYRVILDYPLGEYNEDINAALFVRTTPQKAGEDEEKIELSYSFYGYIRPISADRPKKVRFAFSGLDVNGKMQYIYETDKNGYTSLPLNHHYLKTNVISEGFSKYFVKIIYDQILAEESAQPKILKLSERVLTLTRRELGNKMFDQAENDFLELSFRITEESDRYIGFISVDPKNKESGFHINVQSWLVSTEGKIYPFIGVYNYAYTAKFNPNYQTTIHKYLDIEYIYAKAEYRDMNGNPTMIYYKAKLADLLL